MGEELARFLLPPLLDRLGTDGADLEARLASAESSGGISLGELSSDADELRRRDRRLGWTLGVLSGALGADLLLARRERRGLQILAELVAEAGGQALEPSAASLPDLAPETGAGWELPLLITYFFREVSGLKAPDHVLRWRIERGSTDTVFTVPPPATPVPAPSIDADEAWEVLLPRIPGARLLKDAPGLALAVPHPWFASFKDAPHEERQDDDFDG